MKSEDILKAPKFKKGSVHDLSVDSAFRWVRRNVAVYVEDEPRLKINRPMMGENRTLKSDEVAKVFSSHGPEEFNKKFAEFVKPKKVTRKLKRV